ncbi:hypothetical protein B0A49_06703, partial [Cryomyces minteri]
MSGKKESAVPQQAVRFSSVNQEIEPASNLQDVQTLTASEHQSREDLSPEAQEELRQLSKTLQNSNIQSRRMDHYAFEPVSLPGPLRNTNTDSFKHSYRNLVWCTISETFTSNVRHALAATNTGCIKVSRREDGDDWRICGDCGQVATGSGNDDSATITVPAAGT